MFLKFFEEKVIMCLVSRQGPHVAYMIAYIHHRSRVWGHPDNFVSSMKTHFYLSNELKIELKI